MKLKDPLLLRELCFIDGAWSPADGGGTITVHNPATAEKLGLIPNMGAAECRRAISAAAAALPAWAARTAKDRANTLRRWFGSWPKLIEAFQAFARDKSEWADVLPIMSKCRAEHKKRLLRRRRCGKTRSN